MTTKVLYLCDGLIERCTNCWKTGGECHHTSDITHAANFKRRHPMTEIWWEGGPPEHEESRIENDTAQISLDDLP